MPDPGRPQSSQECSRCWGSGFVTTAPAGIFTRLQEAEAEREALRARLDEARSIAIDLVKCMSLWGHWAGGIPETGQEAAGAIGTRFDVACQKLGLDESAEQVEREAAQRRGEE